VSDEIVLYAADIKANGLLDGVLVYLGSSEPQTELWWLCVEGPSRSPEAAHVGSSASASGDGIVLSSSRPFC
jgi:hypothetical protein